MIRSGAKLAFLTMVPLGGWFAGVTLQYVKQWEVYAFFLLAGVALSLVGCFAFADLERDEAERHGRNLGRAPSLPGREG
ncbi:hypothetical protein SAMN05428997_14611 [Bosea sp. CRIB-10]|uniref:hypothetical protein n=1 Tax=Bosea sp. CRIB-10 TaxID=378404 RepID=UPI0008F18578|nr:hypothetical protein [Bosea sp. CRIB-10]SFD72608.1 hypothetical protein SAMN05428997_14611 [Bosea sp. CRIB-10]